MILNVNVPNDINSVVEVLLCQIKLFLPYKCPYSKELWPEPTYLLFQYLIGNDALLIFDHELCREVLKVIMLLRTFTIYLFGREAAKRDLLAELVVRIHMQYDLF